MSALAQKKKREIFLFFMSALTLKKGKPRVCCCCVSADSKKGKPRVPTSLVLLQKVGADSSRDMCSGE
jgi:hypothetical protein